MRTSILWRGVLALATAIFVAPVQAETQVLASPWKVGTALEYDVEQYDETLVDGELQEATRITDRETIRIVEALPGGGFVQAWTWNGARYELIAGDPEEFALLRKTYEAMAGVPQVVTLDARGQVDGVRNLAEIQAMMDAKVKPLMAEWAGLGMASQLPEGLDEAHRKQLLAVMMQEAEPLIDAMVEEFFAPDRVERLTMDEPMRYNEYTGLALPLGGSRTQPAMVTHRAGKAPLPATVELTLEPHAMDADVAVLRWRRTPAAGLGAEVAEMLAATLAASLPEGHGEVAAAQVTYVDAGWLLVRRATGVIELYESRHEAGYGPVRMVERRRMRLQGSAYDWPMFERD